VVMSWKFWLTDSTEEKNQKVMGPAYWNGRTSKNKICLTDGTKKERDDLDLLEKDGNLKFRPA